MMTEPNRDLSNWIWNCIHIDNLNKATIMPLVRGKEETIANLQSQNAALLEALERHVKMFDMVCGKVNFGDAFLDAETIGEWNDASIKQPKQSAKLVKGNNMASCRKCAQEYEAKDWQIAKSDYLCDVCRKEYFKEYRRNRKDAGNPVKSKKMPRDWRREYDSKHRRRHDVLAKDATRQHLIRRNPTQKQRISAGWALNRAVAGGTIQRMPCENCGTEPAHGRHPDYNKPLEVIWLCPICHAAEHRKARGE